MESVMTTTTTMMMTMMMQWNGLQALLPMVSVLMVTMTSLIECMTIGPERYEDVSFPKMNVILNHTVTCGEIKPNRFIAPTFTCTDIRVDGRKLAYGYYSGWAVGKDETRCHETSGVHEFGQLCLLLLRSVQKDKMGLRAVYVPKSTCSYLNETRKLLKKVGDHKFEWRDFKVGYGWTNTIQCMTAA